MRFLKKNLIPIVAIVIVTILLCGLTIRLTDGFTDFSFQADLNEENLFFEQIEDGRIYGNAEVDAIAENGVITLDGSITTTGTGTAVLSAPIELCTLTLEKGTYTFTCFDDPNRQEYYAVGAYDGYTWYADWEEAPYNPNGDTSLLGRTVTITEETEVTFYIYLCEGAELDNVKARPVLVPGTEPGELTVGLLG